MTRARALAQPMLPSPANHSLQFPPRGLHSVACSSDTNVRTRNSKMSASLDLIATLRGLADGDLYLIERNLFGERLQFTLDQQAMLDVFGESMEVQFQFHVVKVCPC